MIIYPDSRKKEIWDIFTIILTFITVLEIPVRMAFQYPVTQVYFYFEIFISFVYFLDIFFNFNTAHREGLKYVTDKKKLFKQYLNGWFTIDLIAALPLFLFHTQFGTTTQGARFLRLFELNRVLKLTGVNRFISTFQRHHMINPSIYRLINFLFILMVATHWVACGWIILGGIPIDDISSAEKYSYAIYWAVTTLTTVGYGDITPTTTVQRYYTILVMLGGAGSYGFIIGNIAGLLSNIDMVRAGYRKKMEEISAFLKYRSIPQTMQKKVQEYFEHLWESRMGHDEERFLNEIPEPLKTDIALFMRKDLIKKVPFFRDAGENLLRDIVMELRPVVYLPGTFIIKKGETGSFMFIISSGEVDVVSEDGETIYATLTDGSFVGEMALVLDQPRTASVRTKGYCDLYFLEKMDLDKILKQYPKFAEHMKKIVEQRVKERLKKRKKNHL